MVKGVRLPCPPARTEVVVCFLYLFPRDDRDLAFNGFALEVGRGEWAQVFFRDIVFRTALTHAAGWR